MPLFVTPDKEVPTIVDGANAWHRFWRITLPLLRHVITIVLLLSIILTLADFQIVYVLTRGGPANSTHLFSTCAFQLAVPSTDLGMGAAVSTYMFQSRNYRFFHPALTA